MVNKFCPKKHMCVKYKYNDCEGCEDAHTIDLGTKTNFKVQEFTYSEYKNKGESNMTNNQKLNSNIDIPSAYPDMGTSLFDNEFHNYIRSLVDTPIQWDRKPGYTYPEIKNVRISGPCTIIFWEDGTKTVMRCSKIDASHFDPEKAILLAFYRKVTGFSKTHSQKELDKMIVKAYFNGMDEFVKE